MVSHWSSVCPSVVRPSVFSFTDDNFSKYQWFSPNLVCALILWRAGLGLLMGKSMFERVVCPSYDRGGILSFSGFICLKFSFCISVFFLQSSFHFDMGLSSLRFTELFSINQKNLCLYSLHYILQSLQHISQCPRSLQY